METLTELSLERWVAAGRRYVRMRRRYWRFVLVGFALCAFLGFPLALAGHHLPGVLRAVVISAVGLGFLAFWLAAMAAWLTLMSFRCPRCRGRFVISWVSSWPGDRCKHCGLNLGLAGRAA